MITWLKPGANEKEKAAESEIKRLQRLLKTRVVVPGRLVLEMKN